MECCARGTTNTAPAKRVGLGAPQCFSQSRSGWRIVAIRCQDPLVRSIEELTDAIRSGASKAQFREAMQAYSAGAYRAATILLWTSVMQDLTDKLRVLAEAGDAAACTQMAKVDAARDAKDVRGMQAFENGLLDVATTEFEFLTPREEQELRRLGEDRNLCAHPSFHGDAEEPPKVTGEQVRAYARLVVDAALSQPPIVGKALVARFTADAQSDSWPDESLADFLRTRYFDRARSGIMRNILEVAVKAAIRPPDGDNRVAGRCVAATRAACEIDETLVMDAIAAVLTRWRDHMSDTDLVRTVGAVGAFKATWAQLGSENVARLKTLLATASTDTLIDGRAFASGPPSDATVLEPYNEAADRLTDDQVEIMTRKPYPKAQWVPRTLNFVRDVSSWRDGERAIRMLLGVADGLALDDIRVVAEEFVKNNQIHHAADVPQLLELLIERTIRIPGAGDLWREALDTYDAAREPVPDGGDWYDYSAARAVLDRPSTGGAA